jgi:hypothetical protein
MPRMVAVLFEENIEESYVAIALDGTEPEVLFTKGPAFSKIMGPFPEAYAEATFRKWHYLKIINPPEVTVRDAALLKKVLLRLQRYGEASARYGD